MACRDCVFLEIPEKIEMMNTSYGFCTSPIPFCVPNDTVVQHMYFHDGENCPAFKPIAAPEAP